MNLQLVMKVKRDLQLLAGQSRASALVKVIPGVAGTVHCDDGVAGASSFVAWDRNAGASVAGTLHEPCVAQGWAWEQCGPRA